jgi:hypothetical protein
MRRVLAGLLPAALFAVVLVTPAFAMGGDAIAEGNQAQLHPWMADQAPSSSPFDVGIGEQYAAVPGAYAYYGPNGARPLWPEGCPIVAINGVPTVVCGV